MPCRPTMRTSHARPFATCRERMRCLSSAQPICWPRRPGSSNVRLAASVRRCSLARCSALPTGSARWPSRRRSRPRRGLGGPGIRAAAAHRQPIWSATRHLGCLCAQRQLRGLLRARLTAESHASHSALCLPVFVQSPTHPLRRLAARRTRGWPCDPRVFAPLALLAGSVPRLARHRRSSSCGPKRFRHRISCCCPRPRRASRHGSYPPKIRGPASKWTLLASLGEDAAPDSYPMCAVCRSSAAPSKPEPWWPPLAWPPTPCGSSICAVPHQPPLATRDQPQRQPSGLAGPDLQQQLARPARDHSGRRERCPPWCRCAHACPNLRDFWNAPSLPAGCLASGFPRRSPDEESVDNRYYLTASIFLIRDPGPPRHPPSRLPDGDPRHRLGPYHRGG